MSRGGLIRRFPVLAIRDFRLLLADRLIAPASVGFSLVGVSFAVLKLTNSPTDLSYVLAAQIASTGNRRRSPPRDIDSILSRWRLAGLASTRLCDANRKVRPGATCFASLRGLAPG
jgi:hypothetical protein